MNKIDLEFVEKLLTDLELLDNELLLQWCYIILSESWQKKNYLLLNHAWVSHEYHPYDHQSTTQSDYAQ